MNTIKIALAALLVAGTASVATAQEFDPNQANRFATLVSADTVPAARRTFRSAPVRLHQNQRFNRGFQAPIDRERLPHAGGVG